VTALERPATGDSTPSADDTGFRIEDFMIGAPALMAGAANVIMQLALPGVGYGVVESKVENGSAMRHPVKRARTTFTYLSVALLGTEDERFAYREAVNGQHAQVRSDANSPVKYNAFDPQLQLWVAACLYWGFEDVYRKMRGPIPAGQLDAFYQYGARMGTTLQVKYSQWPADRAAFEAYWTGMQERMHIDDTVRGYLDALVRLRNVAWPLRAPLWRFHRFVTIGFLPPAFRAQMRYQWSARDQRRFDLLMRLNAIIDRLTPKPLRMFPFNVYLWDMRKRIRQGRPLV
jgi:uncharacterized protein (DUF2236 family)